MGPDALEVGYWIRTDRAGRGLATEAAGALTAAGLALPGVHRLEIRCDPQHVASWTVARRLGYHHRETVPPGDPMPDRPARATMIWELGADTPPGSALTPAGIRT